MGISVPAGRGEWFFLMLPASSINTANVYQTIYKRTMDFTQINYLMIHYKIPASVYIRVSIGATVLYTETNKIRMWREDVTGYVGDQALMIELKTDVTRTFSCIGVWEAE